MWCIEPDIFTENGEQYEEGDIDELLSAKQQEALEEIAYVGYGYDGDTSNEMLGATQVRMWQELGYEVTHIHADIQAKIENINKNLKMFEKLPSFHGETYRFDAEKTGESNALTLIDTNEVFSMFEHDITASAAYRTEGNTLKIWREANDPMSGSYTFNLIPKGSIGVSHAYISGSDLQSVAYFEMENPHTAIVRYTTEPVNVRFSKVEITTGEELEERQ